MLERTQVYVDTSYLLASFYNSWDTGARAQLEIDLPEVVAVLGQMIQDQLKQPVHRQFWYDGIPDSGPHRYQRSLRSEPGVQLRAGQLIEWGDRRTQKAVDTRLVADIVIAAMKRQVSDIVLVSGDADMLPGVEEAVAAGIRVHLYGFGWDSMSSALRFACDTTTILDPREDFRDTMRLQVLEGPLPAGEQPEQPEDKPLGDAEEPAVEPMRAHRRRCSRRWLRRRRHRRRKHSQGGHRRQCGRDRGRGLGQTTDSGYSPDSGTSAQWPSCHLPGRHPSER